MDKYGQIIHLPTFVWDFGKEEKFIEFLIDVLEKIYPQIEYNIHKCVYKVILVEKSRGKRKLI
jgi:hypothetical protein